MVLEIESTSLSILGKCSTNELYPRPLCFKRVYCVNQQVWFCRWVRNGILEGTTKVKTFQVYTQKQNVLQTPKSGFTQLFRSLNLIWSRQYWALLTIHRCQCTMHFQGGRGHLCSHSWCQKWRLLSPTCPCQWPRLPCFKKQNFSLTHKQVNMSMWSCSFTHILS